MADKDDFEAFSDESPYDDSASNSDSDSDDEFTAKLLAKKDATVTAKDAEEEELERLVLGSKATFREQLFKNDTFGDLELLEREAQLDKAADGSGLDAVDDADLFFIDAAAPAAPGKAAGKAAASAENKNAEAPAWQDSDDERLTVSLAGVSRLRKLRISADEDVVSGAEYAERLRRQFVVLNPLPKWAKESEGRPAKRRRRSSAAASEDISSDSSEEEGDEGGDDLSAAPLEKLLRDVRTLAGRGGADKKKQRLRPEVIDIQRTRPIPDQHKAAVSNLSFHPEYPVLLSASVSSVLFLHHINPTAHPTPNPLLTSVQAKQVDVRRAEFLYPQGDQIFFAGRRRYFHSWDLQSGVVQKTTQVQGHRLEHRSMESFRLSPCGRYMGIVATTKKGGGIVNVVSVASRQWIAAARMDSRHGIAGFAWWASGDGMTVLGRDGSVGEYSMERRRFLGIWRDEGCVGGLVIALGGHHGPAALGGDRWVVVGSSSGVANIYDRNELITRDASAADPDDADALVFKENPEPTKRLEQLVTSITVLAFSPDGQLLAFGSHQKKDALRLVHLPSCTVYRNWPTENTPLGRVTCVAFGRNSDLLAVGNDVGKIRLWEIRS
ncbi:U3 small nucleolar RNA-associated protein [Plectosphaerella cucumerina]|uniref:U3 small nucleolar RNA-associated protein n=1 Tax=Plectosphaerella cucumerina TaxID=40658 RepID=A0A8K0TE09_9PEZI|nr:U3 small nucleolar RNA-associated protein [Plectosphaerella cucumerina]